MRNNFTGANDYYDDMLTTGGWTDNYSNSIRFYPDNKTTPTTEGIYLVRLPGSREDLAFKWKAGQAYTAVTGDPLSVMSFNKVLPDIFVVAKFNGYEFSVASTGLVTLKRYGTQYISTPTPTDSMETYTKYYRIAKVINPDGSALSFQYDSYLRLIKVLDGRNNVLDYTYTWPAPVGTAIQGWSNSRNYRLVNGVTLTSGNGAKQTALFERYKSVVGRDPNGNNATVYMVDKVSSTQMPLLSFVYKNYLQPGIVAFWRNIPATWSGATGGILVDIIGSNSKSVRKWNISQNGFDSYTVFQKTYPGAVVTVEGYSLSDTFEKVGNLSSRYIDASNITEVSTRPTPAIYYQSNVENESSENYMNYLTTSNGNGNKVFFTSAQQKLNNSLLFPYNGKTVSSKLTNAAGKLMLLTFSEGDSIGFGYEYFRYGRKISMSEQFGLPGQSSFKNTYYKYTTLVDGTANNFDIPNKITYPQFLEVENTINSLGQITTKKETSSQPGSQIKTTIYKYYTDTTKPNHGLLEFVDGPRTDVDDKTTYTYDNWGNVATVVRKAKDFKTKTDITLTTTYVGYNNAGQPYTMVHPDGKVTRYTYDARFRKTKEEYGIWANNAFTTVLSSNSWEYNTLNQLTKACDADNKCLTYAYDTLGRLTRTTQPSGSYTELAYHLNGVVKSTVQKSATGEVMLQASTTLDANGRVLRRQTGTDPSRNWIENTKYDINGNLTETTTALGIINSWVYDNFGRIASHTDGMGKVNSRTYDPLDNLTSVTDPLGQTFSYTYKNGSLLKSDQTNALPQVDYTGYNLADNLTEWTQGANRKCVMANYNQDSLLEARDCTQPANTDLRVAEGYTYDHLRNLVLSADTSVSNVSSAKGVKTEYTYDALNRVIRKSQLNKSIKALGLATVDKALAANYTYSPAGRLNGMAYPSGTVASYTYDAAGRVSGIKWGGADVISAISYDGADRMTGWAWGVPTSADKQEMAYTDVGQLYYNHYTFSQTKRFNYNSYDADGRLTSLSINEPIGVPGFNMYSSYIATYDKNSRLTNWDKNSSNTNRTYVYDANGNRTSTFNTDNNVVGTTTSYGYGAGVGANSNNILTSTTGKTLTTGAYGELFDAAYGTPAYDAIGRRKTDTTLGGEFTAWYDYNHANLRTYKRVGVAAGRQFVYDEANHLIGEYTDAGVPVNEYIYLGDKPVAVINGGLLYRIVTDHTNTPRSVYLPGANAWVWTWLPDDAFGANNPSFQNHLLGFEFNLRFPGMYRDTHSRLYYNHNRYYNPELGRYMEPDPIGLQGGLNPYAYAGNNPVMNIDPTGLYSWGDFTNHLQHAFEQAVEAILEEGVTVGATNNGEATTGFYQIGDGDRVPIGTVSNDRVRDVFTRNPAAYTPPRVDTTTYVLPAFQSNGDLLVCNGNVVMCLGYTPELNDGTGRMNYAGLGHYTDPNTGKESKWGVFTCTDGCNKTRIIVGPGRGYNLHGVYDKYNTVFNQKTLQNETSMVGQENSGFSFRLNGPGGWIDRNFSKERNFIPYYQNNNKRLP